MYPAKPQMFPDCSIISASFENVEKVVNPPQSPTVRNKAQLLPSLAVRLNRPHNSPIRKQPTRFTASVAQGNPFPTPFISSETRYLPAPPMKLPAPTTAIFLMMSDTIEFRFRELIYAFFVRIRAGLAAQADSWAVGWKRKRSRRVSGGLAGAEKSSNLAVCIRNC